MNGGLRFLCWHVWSAEKWSRDKNYCGGKKVEKTLKINGQVKGAETHPKPKIFSKHNEKKQNFKISLIHPHTELL